MRARRSVAVVGGLAAVLASMVLIGAPAASAAAESRCDGKRATIVGTPGNDRFVGTPGRDVIVGGDGDDTLIGKGGNDVLCGGKGSDLIQGNSGKDRLFGGENKYWRDQFQSIVTGDTLVPGPGRDFVDPGPRLGGAELIQPEYVLFDGPQGVRIDLSQAPRTRSFVAKGNGQDEVEWHDRLTIVGTQHDDRITGSPKGDLLVGRGGDDTLIGAGGNDELHAEAEPFPFDHGRFAYSGGDDTLLGGPGDDLLTSRKGSDVLRGQGGDDELESRGGRADVLDGGSGESDIHLDVSNSHQLRGTKISADPAAGEFNYFSLDSAKAKNLVIEIDNTTGELIGHVNGKQHAGTITGFVDFTLFGVGTRFDFTGSEAAESILLYRGAFAGHLGGGGDFFQGAAQGSRVDGGAGNDYLGGDRGKDRLKGGSGNDRLRGEAGNDRLNGGAGAKDRVNGGKGRDTCFGEKEYSCEA